MFDEPFCITFDAGVVVLGLVGCGEEFFLSCFVSSDFTDPLASLNVSANLKMISSILFWIE